MTLLSDTIFGNGVSVPGGEDIAVLTDSEGFPYYKGSTFKGVFREELERLLSLEGKSKEEIKKTANELLGEEGNDSDFGSLVFSDFMISDQVKNKILENIESYEGDKVYVVTEMFSNLRTFTRINEYGTAEKGSLRIARCVDKGISFFSEISCPDDQKEKVLEVLKMIKWIGTMRNRGFGKVKITEVKGGQ
ncbi:MAG: hypothetical protein K6G11_05345 [Lachnospiraceae bacterium]|nr:hypothetical protein [Lachnospiraceae bacterium]